jgi:hypothetical protein
MSNYHKVFTGTTLKSTHCPDCEAPIHKGFHYYSYSAEINENWPYGFHCFNCHQLLEYLIAIDPDHKVPSENVLVELENRRLIEWDPISEEFVSQTLDISIVGKNNKVCISPMGIIKTLGEDHTNKEDR